MIGEPWTAVDDARLEAMHLALVAAGQHEITNRQWDEIAGHFPHRSALAVRRHAVALKQRRERREYVANASAVNTIGAMRTPSPQHASITAAVFGDPLPGRSALDRRRELEAMP